MFKKLWDYGRKDSLIRDGILLIVTTMGLNVAGFLFHILMARNLGSEGYGDLGVLLSMIYIINVPLNVIQTTLAKFIAEYKAKKEEEKINALMRGSMKELFFYSLIFFFIILITTKFLSNFLHISKIDLFILSPIIIIAALLPIVRAALQGLQEFKKLGWNLTLEGIVKLSMGFLLVYAGLKVSGAVLALVLSFFIPLIWALFPLKQYLKKNTEIFDKKSTYRYALPVFLSLFFLTALYTADTILVKHFFNDHLAGSYIAASLTGKIVFFATMAITLVMFPKTTENHVLKKQSHTILLKALLFIFVISLAIIFIYWQYGAFVTTLLFGTEYPEVKDLLLPFSIAMTLYSLSYAISFYNLSIGRKNFIIFPAILLIVEIIWIWSQQEILSLSKVLSILGNVMGLLFILLLVYHFKETLSRIIKTFFLQKLKKPSI